MSFLDGNDFAAEDKNRFWPALETSIDLSLTSHLLSCEYRRRLSHSSSCSNDVNESSTARVWETVDDDLRAQL